MVTVEEFKAMSQAKGREQKILRQAEAGMKKKTKVSSSNKPSKKKKKSSKMFTKPKAKGIRKLSAVKAIRGMADEQGALVREVEVKEVVRDDRSLYFSNEFAGDFRREKKWLS